MIRRTFLLVIVLLLIALLSHHWLGRPGESCQICARPLHAETYFRIEQADGKSEDVCCPRCAVRYLEDQHQVPLRLSVVDFKTHALISAEGAFYVEDSDIHPCSKELMRREITGGEYDKVWDRCLPGVLAFENARAAVEFCDVHGGRVVRFSELRRP